MIRIAVINESTAIADGQIRAWMPAFQRQWSKDLAPIWMVDDAAFTFLHKDKPPARGTWWVVFLDDSDQADALAYHDLTNEGFPLSKVFVKTLQADKASISVGATHEICEMAVDPWLNSAYQDKHGVFWAGEICDPVEDDQYGYNIKIGNTTTLVTDFVTPNWFAHEHSGSQMDFRRRASRPYQIMAGGYAQKFDPKKGWVEVSGRALSTSRAAHAMDGTRHERRMRLQGKAGKRSRRKFGRASMATPP